MERVVTITNDGIALDGTPTTPSSSDSSTINRCRMAAASRPRREYEAKRHALNVFNTRAAELSDAGYGTIERPMH